MSVGDFFLLHGQGVLGVVIALLIVLAVSAFTLNNVKALDAVRAIRWGRNILLVVIIAGYGVSLLVSANVSMNHTTIDRSAGDQEQHTLDQRLQNQGATR